jgi:hypothetical protein
MNKKTNKLFILFAVLLTLAMLIPVSAVTVSAAPALEMYLLNPVGTNPTAPFTTNLALDSGFNITGTKVRVVPVDLGGLTVTGWSVLNYPAVDPDAKITASATGTASVPGVPGTAYADVIGTYGVASIIADLSNGDSISVDKKWEQIYKTVISPPQNVAVIWNESTKNWWGTANVTDRVIGLFTDKDGNPELTNPPTDPPGQVDLQGVILHWYLVNGNIVSSIPLTPGFFHTADNKGVNDIISKMPRAAFTEIKNGDMPDYTSITTFTGASGENTITVGARGEEPVFVVVVPEYPNTSDVLVTPEVTQVNFWTAEMEKVPQVRWAGEKIVLEKFFGTGTYPVEVEYTGVGAGDGQIIQVPWVGTPVRFSLENQSPGSLEGIGDPIPPLAPVYAPDGTAGTVNNLQSTVWGEVMKDGYARCMLVCEDQGEVDVDLAVYNAYDWREGRQVILNQHGFVVFYMKLESITLGNVVGERTDHDSGLFTPPNPWGTTAIDLINGAPNQPDDVTASVNVSTDTLLRARVKGWFMGDNMSTNPEDVQDADLSNPGTYLYTLPAGRWILPDDWPILAGPNWKEMRIHWDIMDNPFDCVVEPILIFVKPVDDFITEFQIFPLDLEGGQGPYFYTCDPEKEVVVAEYPVIGPFRPGLELPTPTGYNPCTPPLPVDPYIDQKTVVPNGVLEWWDAPMPPAKITFKIANVSVKTDNGTEIGNAGFFKDAFKTDIYYLAVDGFPIAFTNPFYWQMIPAFSWIPAFVNNGGYDWDSWNTAYGPYQFWKIINRPMNEEMPATRPVNNSSFPSKVQVYSDNHGEAMVYLNGNFALNPALFTFKGQNIPFGDTVGSTTVAAVADYPYFRKHNQLVSAVVTKNWTWGGMVLGPDDGAGKTMILAVGKYTEVNIYPEPAVDGYSKDIMVWIWATDRDGKQDGVLGAQVDWSITPLPSSPSAAINDLTTYTHFDGLNQPDGGGVSNACPPTMWQINVTHGFLNGTNGAVITNKAGTVIRSFLKAPSAAEAVLFGKFWGTVVGADGKPLNANDFAVAAIDLYDGTGLADVTVNAFVTATDFVTTQAFLWNVNFNAAHPLDDVSLDGDANMDGVVTIADITAIERIILEKDSAVYQADANHNNSIDMGDVVATEKLILGIK